MFVSVDVREGIRREKTRLLKQNERKYKRKIIVKGKKTKTIEM